VEAEAMSWGDSFNAYDKLLKEFTEILSLPTSTALRLHVDSIDENGMAQVTFTVHPIYSTDAAEIPIRLASPECPCGIHRADCEYHR
jgi:hypothetical protein